MLNKAVLITGSSRGLGAELAVVFASKGYGVILHGRSEFGLEAVRQRIGQNCLHMSVGDLRFVSTLNKLFELGQEYGVSVLINNAGVDCPAPISEISDEQIDEVIETNLIAPIKLTARFCGLVDTIININSLSGLEAQKSRSLYCASKWGLRGFSDSLQLEGKTRFLSVYPSRIKTKPEYTYGFEPSYVASQIYEAFVGGKQELVLDGREKW